MKESKEMGETRQDKEGALACNVIVFDAVILQCHECNVCSFSVYILVIYHI